MRAQFRPRPAARAIHSHKATGTSKTTITTVMVSGVAVRRCPSAFPWMPPMKGSAPISSAALTAAPTYMILAAVSTGLGAAGRCGPAGGPADEQD